MCTRKQKNISKDVYEKIREESLHEARVNHSIERRGKMEAIKEAGKVLARKKKDRMASAVTATVSSMRVRDRG